MEEEKRGPGRPPQAKKVRFVQMHDAFTPLQMAPIMSLSTIGEKKMDVLVMHDKGVYAETKGRKFVVPYGNISFLELEEEPQEKTKA